MAERRGGARPDWLQAPYLPSALADSRLRRELVEDEFELVDGRIPLPTAPGLGLRLNEAALEEFRVL